MQSRTPLQYLPRSRNRHFPHILRLLLIVLLVTIPLLARAADDALSRARSLAFSGKQHRAEALAILHQHLAEDPDDTDARVFYGIVLSWEGRYDEARAQLSQVLAKKPNHGDALPALINVELWSGHPDRADALARGGLASEPNNIGLLLADARAFRNLNRPGEERKVLEQVLRLDPKNHDAKDMERAMREAANWQANTSFSYDWFSDGRDPLRQTSLSLRGPTPFGSLTGTVNRADQYSLVSYQTELEFYPHFRPGTYGYLEVGYSADGNLYPIYRVGADLFQSVGHGWEISGGYRHLAFSSGVNIYTFSLAKYFHSWLFTTRGFLTPGDAGPSGTALFSARHFFSGEGQHDYVEFRYSRGASPALATTVHDILVLSSSRFSADFDKVLWGRWVASVGGGIGQDQRIGLQDLKQYSLQGSVYYRF